MSLQISLQMSLHTKNFPFLFQQFLALINFFLQFDGYLPTDPPYWITPLGLSIARYTSISGSFIGAIPKNDTIYLLLSYPPPGSIT